MEQHVTFRRVAGMLVGIVIINLGVALFKFAHLGNDPFNALNIRSAELAGLTLGVQNLIYNAVFFTMQMIWGRRYVGFGTVEMPFAVGLSSRFSMISSLRILHRPLPYPHSCRGWLQRWCAPHLAFRCTRPPIWGLPRMITWRWACETTRHSPISAAAFLQIRCAHYWLFCWAGCWGWAP